MRFGDDEATDDKRGARCCPLFGERIGGAPPSAGDDWPIVWSEGGGGPGGNGGGTTVKCGELSYVLIAAAAPNGDEPFVKPVGLGCAPP